MAPPNNDPRRILFVIDSLGSGGAQRQLVSLAIGFAKRGYDVALFNYNPKIDHFRRVLEQHEIKVHDIQKRYRFDLRPAFEIRRILASRRIRAVLSFLDTPNIYAILATIDNRHVKVAVSERFTFSDGRLGIAVWLRFQFYRFADFVTVNSYHQRDRILKFFPWCQPKLHTIWNGVDLSSFFPRQRRAEDSGSRKRMLAVATLVDWKNAYNLIRALALVKDAGIELQIDWAGRLQSTPNSQSEYERCQRQIEELGLIHDWRWLGVCENMQQLYSEYDALVHPSFKEGLPNAICEALATGLPVLASNVCDHPLLIQDGVNGYLFDPQNPDSIAGALIKFSRQSETERAQMSVEARRFAETKLGIDTLVEEYLQILDDG